LLTTRSQVWAVESCKNNPGIDPIPMDIQMPEANGDLATSQISQFNNEEIIILQTAGGPFEERKRALDTECNEQVSKPLKYSL